MSEASLDLPRITIVGLGPAGIDLLPGLNLQVLEAATRRIVRSERHPAVQELRARGLELESLDRVYQSAAEFQGLYDRLADAVLEAAREGPVIYAVPGHPLLGEESVRIVLARAGADGMTTRVISAPSFVDVAAAALASAGELPDLVEWQVADGAALERVWWDTERPTLVFQVDDSPVASQVKLALLEEYPPDHPLLLVRRAGAPDEQVTRVALHEMDRSAAGEYDHLTTVYVPPLPKEQRRPHFRDFVDLVATLRGPQGCPWDREQTPQSLKRFVVEEAYEVLEAVDSGDPGKLCDELGDLMLQVLLYAQLGAEDGYFDIRDVMSNIVEKLVRRHPHVFGGLQVESVEEVHRNWESIKKQEKPERESVLDGVPKELPALMKALEVSKRVVKVGFEWPTLDGVLDKLDEEVAELKAELPGGDRGKLQGELGDLLFTLVNVARWLKIDPEEALRQMVARFGRRFRVVEALARQQGRDLREMDIAELDRLWDEAKATLGE